MAVYGSVYALTNTINGKQYVGMTVKDPKQRFREHVSFSKIADHRYTLAKALRKYGKDAFTVATLCTAQSRQELEQLERHHIAALQPAYNSTSGGDGSYGFTGNVLDKMRRMNATLRGKPVLCVDTGVVYPTATVAAKAFGLPRGEPICKVCRGQRLSVGGIRFTWSETAYTGDPLEIPANHVPVALKAYCVDHRDYSKYKTPEFSAKLREVMLIRKQVPTTEAKEAAWAASRKPIIASDGSKYASMRAAAKSLGVCVATVRSYVGAVKPVPGTDLTLSFGGYYGASDVQQF